MAEMKIERMDVATFLDWATRQEERYELVDGIATAMTGARKTHDRAVRNGLNALGRKLAGGPCEPFTEAVALKVPNGNVRRPDITVDCGRTDGDLLYSDKPVLVVEVLSQSTRSFDLFRKVAEYQSVPSIVHILLIEPDEIAAIHHRRETGGAWSAHTLIGPETEISMPALGLTLALGDFYGSSS
jgi:Uma2 family endonuclease